MQIYPFSGEKPHTKLSDGENVDPNTETPQVNSRKSRHRSVNAKQSTPVATTRARRNKKANV